jgi:putative membrane protein
MLAIDILIALLLGIGAGVITGIAPGIHTNTVAAGVLAFLPILTAWFPPLALGVFLVSMVIVHSFVDFIPSIFLGAPDEAETSLAVLPGHKLLLEGRGYEALKLTVIGGVGTTLVGLAILPLFGWGIFYGYDKLGITIPLVILAFSAFFIWLEPDLRKKFWALIVFLLSGALGLLALNHLPIKEPLFPMFTGLFGISTLIISVLSRNKIAEQRLDDKIGLRGNLSSYVKASLSAALMSVLPALGAAQATVLAQAVSKTQSEQGSDGPSRTSSAREKSGEDFLVMVGGINTVSAIFVLATLFLIGRARTGVIAVMKQFLELDLSGFLILLVASLTAIAFAVVITLQLGKFIAKKITKIPYRKLSFVVLATLIILVGIFSGAYGLLVASTATATGLIAPKAGIKRIHAMGALVFPVLSYYFIL